MKELNHIAIVAVIICCMVSCAGNNAKKKFAPEEKTETMTVEERSKKIDDLKDKKSVDVSDLLNPRDIQISVIVPDVKGTNVSEDMGDRIAVKMLQIAAENGLSGLGVSSAFVLGAEVNQTGCEITSTAPQRMVVKYEIVYKIMNTADGSIFASCSQEITGAGASFKKADINAVSNINSNPKFQKMLSDASGKIVEWYNENLPTLKSQVEAARGDGNYALALALIRAVPQKASDAFTYASQIQSKLLEEYQAKQANENLQAMLALIASFNEDFNPEIGGYFSLIPVGSSQYKEARSEFEKYEKKCKARLTELEAKAERDSVASREMEVLKMNFEQQKELAKIEADKIVGQAEAKANAKAMNDSKLKGFWSRLGNRLIDGIDSITNN